MADRGLRAGKMPPPLSWATKTAPFVVRLCVMLGAFGPLDLIPLSELVECTKRVISV